jgi:RNA-directed DNA polymerase
VSLGQVVGEVNQFVRGWVAYFRYAEGKTHLRELDKWLRHKLRCVRLKQGKRRHAIAKLLIGQGVPERRAWLLALSGKGWWRLSQSPQAQEAFSTRWFEVLGLISLCHRHAALQLEAGRNRRIR